MGTFKVRVEIGDATGNRWESLEALVDTGATYTMVPAPLLRRLGVYPHTRDVFTLADGRQVEHDIGHGWIRVEGRTVITLVVFGELPPANRCWGPTRSKVCASSPIRLDGGWFPSRPCSWS